MKVEHKQTKARRPRRTPGDVYETVKTLALLYRDWNPTQVMNEAKRLHPGASLSRPTAADIVEEIRGADSSFPWNPVLSDGPASPALLMALREVTEPSDGQRRYLTNAEATLIQRLTDLAP